MEYVFEMLTTLNLEFMLQQMVRLSIFGAVAMSIFMVAYSRLAERLRPATVPVRNRD